MRIWQYFSIKEQLHYGESPVVISNSVGLPTSAVLNVRDGAGLASTLFLQYEKDSNRCFKCGGKIKTACFPCYREKVGDDHCIEVIERPNTHKGFMLNVHLYQRERNDVVYDNK